MMITNIEWINEKQGLLFFNHNLRDQEYAKIVGELLINGQPRKFYLSPASLLDCAEVSGFFEENEGIVFALSKDIIPSHIAEEENFYLAGDINQWLSNGHDEKWRLKHIIIQEKLYFILKILKSELPECFQFKFVTGNWEWLPLPDYSRNSVIARPGIANLEYRASKTGQHILQFTLENDCFDLRNSSEMIYKNEKIKIDDSRLLFSKYSDEKLGAWIEKNKTFFALFAPRALFVEVCWKKNLNESFRCFPMIRSQNGIWQITVEENLKEQYYMFRLKNKINNDEVCTEVLDPYAKTTINSQGPGIIVEEKFIKHHFNPPAQEKLIIYECHVRDLIANFSNITPQEKLEFNGLKKFIESNYLQDLGINAIELQPIQEFDNEKKEDYHWGYMPVNYFSPASAYGSDPANGTQIEEFRDLVKTCHDNNLAVILDVVYNHVGDPNHLYKIDPQYYFRTNHDGNLLNFSGCGNDLRTESPMVQKMIVDSLIHFVQTYDVDGFRFDLAELIGLNFLDNVRRCLQKIKPSIIMIAEPWSFRGYVGHDLKKTDLQGWNDEFRDFLKSYILGNGNREGIEYFLRGSLTFRSKFPAQSINYLSSHDDFCWLDMITENINHDGFMPTLVDIRRTHMALAILLLSLGVPMLGEGIELLHSKRGVHNTYQRGDLNALDYSRALEYPLTSKYIQQLIHFRKNLQLFCLNNCPSMEYIQIIPSEEKNSAILALFNGTREYGSKQVILAINPYFSRAHFKIPFANNFTQIADTFSFSPETRATYIWTDDILKLPPLSCGIWSNREAFV
ncbi:MAG: hypothetical protein LBS71_01915 [Puniceicoccales bacterium]|jgi:pullulanase/glycogen debranching enzyme|nr:hypothetical protein [Puniceicoccales bacterium]